MRTKYKKPADDLDLDRVTCHLPGWVKEELIKYSSARGLPISSFLRVMVYQTLGLVEQIENG